jgi:hypothetical protein
MSTDRKTDLPDQADSAALSDNLDYQDVKLKIVQQEGYDEHDFNLFDDRASVLWRKPYVDGAVQELTAGNTRSEDELRAAVEQMMLAAGDRNPDVRLTGLRGQKASANIQVDAQIDEEDQVPRLPAHKSPRARAMAAPALFDGSDLRYLPGRPAQHLRTLAPGVHRLDPICRTLPPRPPNPDVALSALI